MSRQTYMDATRLQYTDVCVGFNATKSITNTIINFYSQFDRYNHLTYVDLYQHISPSIRNNQFKVFHTNGKIWGFANWALLNDNILHFNRLRKKRVARAYIIKNFDIVKKKILTSTYTDIHISSIHAYNYRKINYFKKIVELLLNPSDILP